MQRRRVLASLTGAVSLAGCNILRGPTTGSGRSARETQIAAANDHLQRVFDGLTKYRIVEDGTPAVDPSTYTPADLASLRQEQAAAAAAVDQLNELETTGSTPRPASETVRGGVVLADHRLTIYAAGRRIAVQDDATRRAFVESRYASIRETATAGGDAARTTAAAARSVGDVVARFRASDRVTAPSFYRLDAAASEHDAYQATGSRVGPATRGVAAVGRALTNGVAGRRLLEEAAYADAEAAYEAALDAVADARSRFTSVPTPPPGLFGQATRHGRCGLDTLTAAYTTTRTARRQPGPATVIGRTTGLTRPTVASRRTRRTVTTRREAASVGRPPGVPACG